MKREKNLGGLRQRGCRDSFPIFRHASAVNVEQWMIISFESCEILVT